MRQTSISVAMAILYQNQHFLMQLRDDKPGQIIYSGKWGLFGGHLESAELPKAGVIREIQEEINYDLKEPDFFRCYEDSKVNRYIFYAPLKIDIKSLELNEGQDLALVPLSDIRLGYHYSDKIAEKRYLGAIHQQILLDFAVFALNNLSEFDYKVD